MSELLALKTEIKTEAFRLGFSHFGVAPANPVPHYAAFQAWIGEKHNADMAYLARPDTVAKRGDPRLILENCQSIICLALPYCKPQMDLTKAPSGQGRVSSYALTEDYHHILWNRLSKMEAFIRQNTADEVSLKSFVDTGPILERSFATLAGIGIAGKNTCLIIQGVGSYFFLAEVLTNLPLPVDAPYTRDLCGSCQRCVDACPTGCIQPNRMIDANQCISNLTIEQRGVIPDAKKPLMTDWLFGCDVCQMVCPHNSRNAKFPITLSAQILPECLDLLALFELNEAEFKLRFNKTPLSRSKREGILRNAAIVLGNQHYKPALPALRKCLQEESDPGLLDACDWAILQIDNFSDENVLKGATT